MFFFFFKQKTAYELRISDWSSDVCSSDLERHKIRRIEHFIGQPIPLQTIEGLEPKKTARPTYTDRKGKGRPVRGGYAGDRNELGRAAGREREGQDVWISVGDGTLQK